MRDDVWFVVAAVIGVAVLVVANAVSMRLDDDSHPVLDDIEAEIDACEAAHGTECRWVWHGDAEPEGQ